MLLVGKWVMQSSLRILDAALLRSISVYVENPNKHGLLSKHVSLLLMCRQKNASYVVIALTVLSVELKNRIG